MLGPSRRLAGLAMAGVLVLAVGARADIVELANGVRVEGTVTEATAAGLRIKIRDREVWIPQARVRAIIFESAAPVVAPPAAPSSAPAVTDVAPPSRIVPTEVATALSALDRLQAETGQRLPAGEYVAHVERARQDVERALGGVTEQQDVRQALDAALHYHAVAAHAEAVYASRGELASIRLDPTLRDCRPLGEVIARDTGQLRLDPESPGVVGLLVATEGGPALRECAGAKIAEAEALARGPLPPRR